MKKQKLWKYILLRILNYKVTILKTHDETTHNYPYRHFPPQKNANAHKLILPTRIPSHF